MVAPIKDPLLPKQSSPLTELPIAIELKRGSKIPMHQQLAQQLRDAVLSGALVARSKLPGSRSLASHLGVTRGVVAEAYATLVADGTFRTEIGQGTCVSPEVRQPAKVPQCTPTWIQNRPPAPVDETTASDGIDFRAGVATTTTLDTRAWRQAWAEAARAEVLGDYTDTQGEPLLRAALAAFVARSRGLATTPEQILITAGTLQAMNLITNLLPPQSDILFEQSGYRAVHQVLADSEHRLHYVPVDCDGPIITPDLPPAKLAFVTPSHQFPLGGRMCLPRRLALLEWANKHDALIIEDDYDGEFRYDSPPLPTLASLDTCGRVIYLGTLSKVLTPTIRTGYLIAPPALMPALIRARTLLDFGHPLPVQLAVMYLLTKGHIDKHIRRTRRWHGQIRDVLTRILKPLEPQAHLGGIEAGLHVCLHLQPPLKAKALAKQLQKRNIYVSTLESYTFAGDVPNALLLGFGGLTAAQAEAGAQGIAEVIRAVSYEA